ncbi:alkene reductase [Phanerochaete sordida]|uniref:Alkene reductase n=1 Tax=Phanerochaete sordida TaxID=48140 RepID=A0A9P3FWW6_9APHY|nr:alkene reductase [Phanerochaete sordida]
MALATNSSPNHVPHLSEPLQLGDLTLRNRNIVASALRNRSVPTNVPNDLNLEYYVQRAKGGAGLIMTEGTLVSQQGTEWPHNPGIWSEEQVAGWKKITEAVHAHGTHMFCQLWHTGRVSHPDMEEQKRAGKPVPGPSSIAARGGRFRQLFGAPGYVTPTPIEDPWTIVEEFRHAANMAKKAGFDGVELHSASGYLIHQFLDHTANQRTDMWGGSVENRCRLGLEVLKAMIDVWGPARVGIKISPCGGYNDVGMPLPDTLHTYTYYLTQLGTLKPAYIQLVRHNPRFEATVPVDIGGTVQRVPRATPHDVLAVYAGIVRTRAAHLARGRTEAQLRGPAMPAPAADARNPSPTRVFVNGGLTPAEADALIAEDVVDGAAFATLWICNPDLQRRAERGLPLGKIVDYVTLYAAPEGKDLSYGYTDYPFADPDGCE